MDALQKRGRRDREKKSCFTSQIWVEKCRANIPFLFSEFWLKSWLANTSRDSFKFCQLLGKGCQARFSKHDLLHEGMEQGEVLVSAAELWELRDGDDDAGVRQVVTHAAFNTQAGRKQQDRYVGWQPHPWEYRLKQITLYGGEKRFLDPLKILHNLKYYHEIFSLESFLVCLFSFGKVTQKNRIFFFIGLHLKTQKWFWMQYSQVHGGASK